MTEFRIALEWFVYGLICGFSAIPVYKFLTKFWEELKIAREQWHKGPDR